MNLKDIPIKHKAPPGSQGTVGITKNGYAVKEFYNPTPEIEDKTKFMCTLDEFKSEPNIAWPLESVYDEGRFVGYIMRAAPEGAKPLTTLFNSRIYEIMGTKGSVVLAYNLVSAVATLHQYGVMLCDYNPNNFFFDLKGNIFIVDTDNFQFENLNGRQYKRNVACPLYLTKEIHEKIIQEKKKGVDSGKVVPNLPYNTFSYKSEIFGLMILVFQILMNGCHPFVGMYDGVNVNETTNILKGYIPYFGRGNKDDIGENRPSIDVLDKGMRNMFEGVFLYGKVYTHAEILTALRNYNKNLAKSCCASPGLHKILVNYNKCPWCELNIFKDKVAVRKSHYSYKNDMTKDNGQTRSTVGNANTTLQKNTAQTSHNNVNNISSSSNNQSQLQRINKSTNNAMEQRKKIRTFWNIIIVITMICIQMGLYADGGLHEYYELNLSDNDFNIFRDSAYPFLVISGIIVTILIAQIFNSFSNMPIVVMIILEFIVQAIIYAILIWLVGVAVTIISYLFYAIIVIGIIVFIGLIASIFD